MVTTTATPRANPDLAGRFIYLTGCDGTGKSTQAAMLLSRLEAEQVGASGVWLRFPFFLSLPLLAYARWRGLSWYEGKGSYRHGYWDFQRSWLLQALFPRLLWLDASVATLLKIRIPMKLGRTIVCERHVLDMLVDLAIALGWPAPGSGDVCRRYLSLLPADASIFVLDLDAEIIRARRSSLQTDRLLEARLEAYRQLSARLTLPLLSNRGSPEDLHQTIWQRIAVHQQIGAIR